MPPSRAEVDRILDTNSAAEFESLRGLPGVCLEPTGWAAACQLVHEGSEESLGKLGRHPRDTVVYRNFRRQTLEKYASMEAFVKLTILGYAAEQVNGRLAADLQAGVQDASIFPLWRLNDFPYNLEAGMEHHNIWNPQPLTAAHLEEVIAHCRSGYDCIWFVNPEPLASIPGVWHAHCFSRPKEHAR